MNWFLLGLALTSFLSAAPTVVGISGSIRQDSYNTKLLHEAIEIAESLGSPAAVVDLGLFNLPFYNGDLEAKSGMPAIGRELRKELIAAERLIIATPEYNGSISPLLLNMIDWMSRSPDGKPNRDVFMGKKVLILSASPGQGGGARALEHLRGLLGEVGAVVITKQMALPNAHQAFDNQGHLVNSDQKKQLQAAVQELLK